MSANPWDAAKLALKQRLRSWNRARLRRRHTAQRADYAQWVARFDTIDVALRGQLQARAAALVDAPLMSIVMPTYNPDAQWLTEAVQSVRAQVYPHWQLCIADDASTAAHVRPLLRRLAADDERIVVVERSRNGHICAASNSALELASGAWVVLMDHDDRLAEHALLLLAEAAARRPEAALIYSDEDMLGPDGARESPYFKPDWNEELCRSQNYVCHLLALRRPRLQALGGLHEGFEGAQDHDLVLRFTQGLLPRQIVHVPHVLYHWRRHAGSTSGAPESKPYATEAGRRAVQAHCDRVGERADVRALGPGRYHVSYAVPPPSPCVEIVVPTRDQPHLLKTCIQSLLRRTRYANFALLIVDNGSTDTDALAYLQALIEGRTPEQITRTSPVPVRVLRDPLQPFNYAALNNRAVAQSQADVLVLMNNDIEVLDGDWLSEMVGHAMRPHVGAVGAKLLYPDRTVQHAGVVVGLGRAAPRVASPAFKGLGAHAGGHGGRANVAQSMTAVTAACMAVRRDRFLQVGGLDEANLAVAYNDVDLCLKLAAAGYINIWTPHATLLHHESISRGRDAAAPQQARFVGEAAWMQARWGEVLARDPNYNPNLNLSTADFALADPPRATYRGSD